MFSKELLPAGTAGLSLCLAVDQSNLQGARRGEATGKKVRTHGSKVPLPACGTGRAVMDLQFRI